VTRGHCRARLLAMLLILFPAIALAWGPSGHRMVAQLAEERLDSRSHAEVRHLLGVLGARSLADIANWADEMRSDPAQRELSRATSRLHFVNFTDSRCTYDAPRICANGQCVVAAIQRHAAVLGDRSATDRSRAEALRYLVHFVGDAHQPLHAGYRSDRGGNNHQVRFNGKGSNLHAIWDSPVLASRRLRWNDHARRLERQPLSDNSTDPLAWAEQSCRISRDGGLYPQGRTIDKAYLERMRPIAERQIRRAGKRLANLLNRALD